METDYSIFIGRFQPPTIAHQKIINDALKVSKQVIIIIGSYHAPITIKNPWNFEQRKELILGMFDNEEQQKLIILPLRDYLYNDIVWLSSVQNQVSSIVGNSKHVKLFGHFKDDSSYYLKYFPQWELIERPNVTTKDGITINATDVRNLLFDDQEYLLYGKNLVPKNVFDFIIKDSYYNLKKEFQYYKDYLKPYKDLKYKPIFHTADSVVMQSGHVLVVKRKTNPGINKYAIPGGFIGYEEKIEDAALRELREETKIDVPKTTLKKCIVDNKVFDHPYRSLRGRIITTAFNICLDNTRPLPIVKGDDDAISAKWMPFNDLYVEEENFFEDHLSIIQYFLHKR